MKQFYIDEQFLKSVEIHYSGNYIKEKKEKTEEDIILLLQGKGDYSCHSSIDHPEFTRLRNELEEKGLIKTERRWWNGDRVLKPFKLNHCNFQIGMQFSCAAAIQYDIKKAREKWEKRNLNA
jgi:hypothetical protein